MEILAEYILKQFSAENRQSIENTAITRLNMGHKSNPFDIRIKWHLSNSLLHINFNIIQQFNCQAEGHNILFEAKNTDDNYMLYSLTINDKTQPRHLNFEEFQMVIRHLIFSFTENPFVNLNEYVNKDVNTAKESTSIPHTVIVQGLIAHGLLEFQENIGEKIA